LVEQGIGLGQPPAVERPLGRAGQLGPVRIVRFERRQLVSRLREMGRDLDEPRRQFLVRYILFAENFEKFAHGGRGEPEFRRQFRRPRLGLRLGLRRGGHLIGESLRHCHQHGRVLVVYRVVDGAVADRSPDGDAFGHSAVARGLDRARRQSCCHSGREKEGRPKCGDYFLVVSTHDPAVTVPPEAVLVTVEPETPPPIFTPCCTHSTFGDS
jgi:hypothetical protein